MAGSHTAHFILHSPFFILHLETACSPKQRHEAQTFDSAGANHATRTTSEWSAGLLDCWSDEKRSRWFLVQNWHHSISPPLHLSIFHGMSTGQACRASVLTSACLRASGASPRRSANFQ